MIVGGDKPRYEVHSVTGCTINPEVSMQSAATTTSYCVLDSHDSFREVASFYSRVGGGGGRTASFLRARAEEACARLNAEEEAEKQRDLLEFA